VSWSGFIVITLLKAAAVLAGMLSLAAAAIYWERRICAFIQGRVGPNRAGPFGLLQPMADAVKTLLKEDYAPGRVRKFYFSLAPAVAMFPGLAILAVIPFGSNLNGCPMVVADLNIGLLYALAVNSVGVYGIVLAGYASNSKYPFMGGIRSSAQIISYEVTMGLSVVPLLLLAGSLNLGRIVECQSGGLFHWMIFRQPLAFALFVIASFAETNRLPFDLPEAEQELVGGYNVEYGSMRFAMFFLGEYASMIAAAAMIVTLFLGGWTLPWFGLDQQAATFWTGALHIAIFLAKVKLVVLGFIWTRWMWPRFRYDQLMSLGWRKLLPLALANMVLTAFVLWARA